MGSSAEGGKFSRVFKELGELKERVVKIEVHEEHEKAQVEEVSKKLDTVTSMLHEIVGRESVRAGMYGVIGSIVSGVVVWLVTLIKSS